MNDYTVAQAIQMPIEDLLAYIKNVRKKPWPELEEHISKNYKTRDYDAIFIGTEYDH